MALSGGQQELELAIDDGKKADDADGAAFATPHRNFKPEYVTGFKLVLVVAPAVLACFLMLVDTMVISTVRTILPQIVLCWFSHVPSLGYSSHHR